MLRIKEQQFVDALVAALGVEVSAIAVPSGTPEPSGPFAAFAPAAVMGPIVAGQAFDVRLQASVRGDSPIVGRLHAAGASTRSTTLATPTPLVSHALTPGPAGRRRHA